VNPKEVFPIVNRYLKPFMPLVDAFADTLGRNCEVVLHDFTKPHQSIIKIANSHVTGREVGGPATDLILSFIEKKGQKNDALIGYRTKTKGGNELKSSTVFIRNGKNKIVGALCINIDLTPYLSTKNLLDDLCVIPNSGPPETGKHVDEKFETNVKNVINDMLEKSIKRIGKPIAHMRKEDKLAILRDLKGSGLFLIKGTAQRVSKELNVSLPTIYKYLEEIREILP
jgi:predicted transcriptional regulator YheO